MKRFGWISFAFAVCSGVLAAQQIKTVPVTSTVANDGREMFSAYCAACHGTEGRGDGPAAAALKRRPADLTQLARKNNGVFPAVRVKLFIKGNDEVAAHGTREMPVWGPVLQSLAPTNRDLVALRIRNLEQYIESLQAQ